MEPNPSKFDKEKPVLNTSVNMTTFDSGRNKRRRCCRHPTVSSSSSWIKSSAAKPSSSSQEDMLSQTVQNSKWNRGAGSGSGHRDTKLDVPFAPTFYPTIQEMEDNPLVYVEKIKPIAKHYGIIRIVPPKGWNPPVCADFNSTKKFSTKHQLLHRLQEGVSFGDGQEYNGHEYTRMASKKSMEWRSRNYRLDPPIKHAEASTSSDDRCKESDEYCHPQVVHDSEETQFTATNIERDYWDIVDSRSFEMAVEYGNDIDTLEFGSGFPISERGRSAGSKPNPDKIKLPEPSFGSKEYYKESYWNLNNISWAPGSVLRHVKVPITGINVPWLYYGSLFTTFCWHNEDNYLYSISYLHKGAPKLWYGIPGSKDAADGLEKVFKNYLNMQMRDAPDLLHHITTMFSPRLLQKAGVPVYKLLQNEGEFIITFPRSFHGGFSFGPNLGEAVNFAANDWIAYGSDANERYRSFARPSVFSHDRLVCTMANHIEDQKSYAQCKLLLEELERAVREELHLRKELISSGVRDVSNLITLPPNCLDQLDEASADYDDKRSCYACNHVCFFSAVACECSQLKVSCLRHSHYMCRCCTERKYLMVWCESDEMSSMLYRVQEHLKSLEGTNDDPDNAFVNTKRETTSTVRVEWDFAARSPTNISLDPVDDTQRPREVLPETTTISGS